MEPYLIIFDMDGTLLNDKKKISLRTKRYLIKLTKQGHKIILASGRPSRAMKSYHDELYLTTPIICYNGAYCFSSDDPNFPTTTYEFPKEIVKDIYKKIKPYSLNVMCESDTEIWVDSIDNYLAKFFWYDNMNIVVGDIDKTLSKNPMTMIAHTPNDLKDKQPIIDIVNKYPNLEVRFWSGAPYFELFYKNISKGTAAKLIADYYQIPKERIIAFGDAENDLEMIEMAGYGFVMKNGKESLKTKDLTRTLKDNNHNGIYHALKKILK